MKVKMLRKKLNWKYVFAIIYMIFIFYLSSIPLSFSEAVNKADPNKFFLHIAQYSVLGSLLFFANKNTRLSFFIGSIYGLSDEVHQSFLPFREFNVLDILADVIGVYLGIIVLLFLVYKLKK